LDNGTVEGASGDWVRLINDAVAIATPGFFKDNVSKKCAAIGQTDHASFSCSPWSILLRAYVTVE
jgi:hypothetical protein